MIGNMCNVHFRKQTHTVSPATTAPRAMLLSFEASLTCEAVVETAAVTAFVASTTASLAFSVAAPAMLWTYASKTRVRTKDEHKEMKMARRFIHNL